MRLNFIDDYITDPIDEFIQTASIKLNTSLHSALAITPLHVKKLSDKEQAIYFELQTAQRKKEWLCGRKAMKAVLAEMGLNIDSTQYELPNPHLSLSHNNSIAIALGSTQLLDGIGIDIENDRDINPDAANLIFTKNENQQYLFTINNDDDKTLASQNRAPENLILKSWCIKEAAFKATIKKHQGTVFQYEIDDIKSKQGIVRQTTNKTTCRYFYSQIVHDDIRMHMAIAINSSNQPALEKKEHYDAK